MRRILSATVLIFILYGAAAAQVTEFSAECLEKDCGSVRKGNIYVANKMSRYDSDDTGEITINRFDRGIVWIIVPSLKLYTELPGTKTELKDPLKPEEGTFGDMTRKFVGFDTEGSYRLRKYLITVRIQGKEELASRHYEWYRDNFPLPLRIASLDGNSSFEYVNIKIGRPNPELFAKPSRRFKKVTIEELDAVQRKKQRKKEDKEQKRKECLQLQDKTKRD